MKKRLRLDWGACPRCGGKMLTVAGIQLCLRGHAVGEQDPKNPQPRDGVGRIQPRLAEEN